MSLVLCRDLECVRKHCRGRITLFVCDNYCSDEELGPLRRGVAVCRDCVHIDDNEKRSLETLYKNILDMFLDDAECIITICVNGLFRRLYREVLELYGNIETSPCSYSTIPKNVVDRVLKCVSIADTIAIVGLETPWKYVVDIIPLAISLGIDVVVECRGSICRDIEDLTAVEPLDKRPHHLDSNRLNA